MAGSVSLQKSRTVSDIRRDPRRSRKLNIVADNARVALIAIEEETPFRRRSEVCHPSGDSALAFDFLTRVDEVKARPLCQKRRLYRRLRASNEDAIDRDRKKDVGVSEDVVIEEVAGVGAEGIEIEIPSRHRHRQANFRLTIALAVQRQKIESLCQRELQKR